MKISINIKGGNMYITNMTPYKQFAIITRINQLSILMFWSIGIVLDWHQGTHHYHCQNRQRQVWRHVDRIYASSFMPNLFRQQHQQPHGSQSRPQIQIWFHAYSMTSEANLGQEIQNSPMWITWYLGNMSGQDQSK